MHPPAVAFLLALVVADGAAANVARAQVLPLRHVEDTLIRPAQLFDVTRFDSSTAVTLRALLDTAIARGLPTTPLVNRALEGSARRVVGSRIIIAVRAHLAAMTNAQRVLGVRSTAAQLDAAAEAMKAGVDGGTLHQLHEARPGNSIIKPLVVLTDILGRGIPFATANHAVLTLARLPGSDDHLDTLQSLVAKNVTRGGPTMAVEALNRYLRETLAANAARPPNGPVIHQQDR